MLTAIEYEPERMRNTLMNNRFKYFGKVAGKRTSSAIAQTVIPF